MDKLPLTQQGETTKQNGIPAIKLHEVVSKTKTTKHFRKKLKKKKHYDNLSAEEQEDPSAYLGVSAENAAKTKIDFVLVYEDEDPEDERDKGEREKKMRKKALRTRYQGAMTTENLIYSDDMVRYEGSKEMKYLLIHVPFDRLCYEAEKVKLEMPLKGYKIQDDDNPGCFKRFEEKYLVTDDTDDYVSAPFERAKIQHFQDSDKPDVFFRSSLRCMLAHHILINMDIRDERDEREEDPMAKKGLPYLLMKGVYKDAYPLHDESAEDPIEIALRKKELGIEDPCCCCAPSCCSCGKEKDSDFEMSPVDPDPRKDMNQSWPKLYKYQPMWKIRDYFGEKIALYFAWSGMLISTLWIPTIFGLSIFFYGLFLSVRRSKVCSETDEITASLISSVVAVAEDVLKVIKESFDNEVTPWFALVICLWGTIFLEMWKRKNAVLAYEWDVNNFESSEPDRPQFKGMKNKTIIDPVTNEQTWYYPFYRQIMKYAASFSVLCLMVCVVFISVAAVIVYRVILTVDYCPDWPSPLCLGMTSVVSSLLNAVSILVLGKLYDKIAYVLTEWENHRTQTEYDDALIIKLFAFQFANSYASLFYIAFFRGTYLEHGILGLGHQYQDDCGGGNGTLNGTLNSTVIVDGVTCSGGANSCMSMLAFQVLVLMIAKPFPKLFKDIILKWILQKWKKRTSCRKTQVVPDTEVKVPINDFIIREREKPELGDFTLSEYTEKVIQYGYLMLFSVSLPLGPLIALLTNLFDKSVDAKRILWMYRRPVSQIAQDIGMWYSILEFVNVCGVISNAFLIAFTSSWGHQFDAYEKLWMVIIFEHIVFGVKWMIGHIIPDKPNHISISENRHIVFGVRYIVNLTIPDIPVKLKLAMQREKYQVSKILERGIFLKQEKDNLGLFAVASKFVGKTFGSLRDVKHTDDEGDGGADVNSNNSNLRKRKHKRKDRKKNIQDEDQKSNQDVPLIGENKNPMLGPLKKKHHRKHKRHMSQEAGYAGDVDDQPSPRLPDTGSNPDQTGYPTVLEHNNEDSVQPRTDRFHCNRAKLKSIKRPKNKTHNTYTVHCPGPEGEFHTPLSYGEDGATYMNMQSKFPSATRSPVPPITPRGDPADGTEPPPYGFKPEITNTDYF